MSSRPTLADVAAAAGVHPSTVSRVFSRHATLSEETRLRVRKAAEDLGYVPNVAARNLVTGVAHAFGFVMPDDINPVYLELAHAFSTEARDRGYDMSVRLADPTVKEAFVRATKLLLGGRVDGIATYLGGYADREQAQLIRLLRDCGTPSVVLSMSPAHNQEGDSVVLDMHALYVDLFVALLRDGARRIAAPTGARSSWFYGTVEGAWTVAQQQGPWDKAELLLGEEMDEQTLSQDWVKTLARRWRGKFAIVTHDSLLMAHIMRTLNAAGLPFPERVTLAGAIHPTYACYLRDMGFWVIDWPILEISRVTVDRLIAQMKYQQAAAVSVTVRPRIHRINCME